MSLKEYAKKRDFKKTAEPKPGSPTRTRGNRFVVQKHDATRLHYDLRLELDGALKSWAVPKGFPYAKGEKHLAVQVEDHPLSYIDFEGTIPEGQYGGGTVMIWDRGLFEPLSNAPKKDLAQGKLHFVLSGTKLNGEWYLVRLRDEKQWLLIKAGEDMKPVSKKLDDLSVNSNRSMKELARGDRIWQSKSASETTRRSKRKPNVNPLALPQFVAPMSAKLVESIPSGDWFYEIKFDGFRALALRGGSEARLLSRNEQDFGGKFTEVMDSLSRLDLEDAIVDGEIVALDEKGLSSFQLLQAFDLGQERPPVFYYAFDLLRLNGRDLRELPIERRKAKLESLLTEVSGTIRYSAILGTDAGKLLDQARLFGLEGLIGKRVGSLYESGRATGNWIKLKLQQQQEFVLGGYTEPEGARSHFGALLVGVYDGNQLKFAGRVGAGFNEKLFRDLLRRFKKIPRETSPFVDLPEKRAGSFGRRVTASEMKLCHWIEPEIVGEIKFKEWTMDHRLRQPVFLGLRGDKDAKEVVREKAS
ncbi:MAG: non-homologous end-joining DNA ligase [Verrucomicrobia bacterium]|nr:non-homologous end-joining DNA ligase [Verrucomicrobiota bacterium]